jgi:hypothetical protein
LSAAAGHGDGLQRVAKWPAKRLSADLEDVARLRLNARGEAQGGRAEKVTVHVARAAEARVFEVVVFQVGERVGHVGLAGQEWGRP